MSQSATYTHILPKFQNLGYPQSDVSFQIDTRARTLLMKDLDKGGRSLTNDIQNALCRVLFYQKMRGKGFAPDEYTIFYQNSDGEIDGVAVTMFTDVDNPLRQRMKLTFYPIPLRYNFYLDLIWPVRRLSSLWVGPSRNGPARRPAPVSRSGWLVHLTRFINR